ncbi:MAG: M23 family metallopeptidase [Ignavibacteria bacterium]|nr:M23 family metallopeptidase [Ignavibacteria bacterium]
MKTILLFIFSLCALTVFSVWKNIKSAAAENTSQKNVHGNAQQKNEIDFFSNFIWPTDASRTVTNNFGAFRKSHFHEGIDISTNRRTGYKVFAIKDGYVSRIWVSPNGYGKQLTMKHTDGTSSSFSHLEGFHERLEEIVRNEQQRIGGYEIDIAFTNEKLFFYQGEMVAFTGETGVGPPHLHFEVYDNYMNPVNPLKIESYKFEDNSPPIIGRLLVVPLRTSSLIDGMFSHKRFSTKKKSAGNYSINKPIHISGSVGFAVYTEDIYDANRKMSGLYTVQFFLDDSLVYEANYDSLLEGNAKMIALHYNYSLMRSEGAEFQKLYVEEGNRLPLYRMKTPLSGAIQSEHLTPGEHHFKIISKDLAGNYSICNGTIFSNHIPEVSQLQMKGKYLTFFLNNNTVDEILFSSKTMYGSWKTKRMNISEVSKIHSNAETELMIPISKKEGDVLRIVARTVYGTSSFPSFYYFKKPATLLPSVKFEKEMFGSEMMIRIKANGAFTKTPMLGIREGSEDKNISVKALNEYEYQGSYFPSTTFIGERVAELRAEIDGIVFSAADTFSLYPIHPLRRGEIYTRDGGMKITFEKNAVYQPLFFSYSEKNSKKFRTYSLFPEDVMLDGGVNVTLFYPQEIESKHLGLFFQDGARWKYLSSKKDTANCTLTSKLTRTLGIVALFVDSVSPTLTRLKIRGTETPIVSFGVHDDLSGVNVNDAKIFIDGKLIVPQVSEGGTYSATLNGLHTGKHYLKIAVKDRMGNETIMAQTVAIR